MTDQPIDVFDAQLVDLLTGYGERAMRRYDSGIIARGAMDAPRRGALRLGILTSGRARLLLLAAGLALLALAAVLLAGVHRPTPIGDVFASPREIAWSPDGANLAFVVEVADASPLGASSATGSSGFPVAPARVWHSELWVVGGDGGEPRKLMTFASLETPRGLIWTHDGRSLVLGIAPTAPDTAGALVEVGIDGTPVRTLLTTGGSTPTADGFSPATDELAYTSGDALGEDLYVLKLGNGDSTRLTTSHHAAFASWSPDGRWILYEDDASRTQPAGNTSEWIASADGTARHEIGPCCFAGWSADSTRVFLQENGESTETLDSVAVDGSSDPVAVSNWFGVNWTASTRGILIGGTSMGVATLRPGEAAEIVTGTVGDPFGIGDYPIAASPDGFWIAFSGHRDGVSGTYIIPWGGGAPRRIGPDVSGGVFQWRPSKPEFTFVNDRAILSVRADGTGLREIVGRSTIAGDPLGGADSTDAARIVLGPTGPNRDTYRVIGRTWPQVTVENRSAIRSVPWGITEKNACQLLSGPAGKDPCIVEPGAAVQFTAEGPALPGVDLEVRLGPAGSDPTTAIPVVVEFVPTP